MEKFFDEKGNLTEWARRVMLDLTYGLGQLMGSDDVMEMTENELRLLGSHLASMMGDAISKRITRKRQQLAAFDQMTDEQFYDFLKEKYGNLWMLLSLTEEELARVPRLTDEEIRRALQEGADARRAVEEAFVPPRIDPGQRFK